MDRYKCHALLSWVTFGAVLTAVRKNALTVGQGAAQLLVVIV